MGGRVGGGHSIQDLLVEVLHQEEGLKKVRKIIIHHTGEHDIGEGEREVGTQLKKEIYTIHRK